MTPTTRTVRIFISSTFRDFGGERDILVRKVFPELRRRCRERQVELVDVDLRWGITEAEAQQGKVLPICLAEIDRSRPYFIGLLGERYGWVPQAQQFDPALVQEQPWLSTHAGGKSVTELEMLHGVLNNPAMAGHAFFYFRDPQYAQGRGGDYAAESPEHQAKLGALKKCIRGSGFPLVEDYADPDALAQRVQEDLWQVIDAKYPAAAVPDALALERRRHESYGASRLGLYLGGENYLASLNTAIAEGRRTVLVTGESGGGKSALLANWLAGFRQRQPEAHLFVHHLGATNDAGEPDKLVRRWIEEMAEVLGEEVKLPGNLDKLYEELPQWLAKAGDHARRHSTRWIIVLDALDKLREGRDLRWLPGFLPEGIQLLATCLTGEVLTAARRRLPQEVELEVMPLEEADRRALIRDYLGKYRKSLTREQEQIVLAHPLAGNPLFLRMLLEELRVFGVHEALDQRLAHYLTSVTVDDLFERVLERIEQDTSANHVRASMEALWASRAGLAQEELLAVTGLAAAHWAAVQLGLDQVIIESGGRLVFAHDYLRKAVEDRYLPTAAAQRARHRRLAEHFAKREPDARVAEELPWQWQHAADRERLKECLTQREMFWWLDERDRLELLRYWVSLMPVNINAAYETAWAGWGCEEDTAVTMAFRLAGFLWTAGCYSDFAVGISQRWLEQANHTLGPEHPDTLSRVDFLATLLSGKGDYDAAEPLYRRALETQERILGPEHPHTLMSVNNLAILLNDQGDYAAAEPLYRRALEARERILGPEHPDTLRSLSNLANLLSDIGDYAAAEPLRRRALEAQERILGPEHPITLGRVNNLANLLAVKGDYDAAEPLYRRALETQERILGPEHPATLRSVNNLASLLSGKGDCDAAEPLYRRALEAHERILGPEHPATLRSVSNLALLLSGKGDYDAAEPLYRRALETQERILGPEHPDTLTVVYNLALLLSDKGDKAAAEPLYRRALEARERILGPEHPDTLASVNNLADLLSRKGDKDAAEPLFRRAVEALDRVLGSEHSHTLVSVSNLAGLLSETGRVAEAVVLLREHVAKSEACLPSLRYTLACSECLSGNLEEAKRLIAEELVADSEKKHQALASSDLVAIHDFIRAIAAPVSNSS